MYDIKYGTTKDGLTAALIKTRQDTHYYALKPDADGYSISGGVGNFTQKEFINLTGVNFEEHLGYVPSIDAFKAKMADFSKHYYQLDFLERKSVALGDGLDAKKVRTPWGIADRLVVIRQSGVLQYSNAEHSGFKLYANRNKKIPAPFRNEDRWYRAPVDAAKVVHSFPDMFTDLERRNAIRCLKEHCPDEYEAVTGEAPERDMRVDRDTAPPEDYHKKM